MNLKRPLYFFAIAVAMVSSIATQSYAQETCDAFIAAIEARGDATIVSGLNAEEAIRFGPDVLSINVPFFDNGQILSGQGIPDTTPQLTLPSGTLCFQTPLRDGFNAGDIFTIEGDVDGESIEYIFFFGRSFDDFEDTVQGIFTLKPDSDLGDACGVCFPLVADRAEFVDQEQVVIEIFDGDTSIAQITPADEFSFIAAPGQTITRIEFLQIPASDILVAFKETVVAPPEEVSSQQCLADIAAEIGALADAATDSHDAYALNVACAALNFAAKDEFFEDDGNRLTRFGSNVFVGAAYAICYLEHTGVEGTEDIVDRILAKLEQIVDDEIAYAMANGGKPEFIDRAEDLAELAEWIDEDLDNPVVATIAYKLAWANAYFATY